ncbi:endonuclease/exonuclease/phosphatase family protein [Candidatus Liberibacter solanacearum]|uniref:endonuclease/exonuclease/phosphatase family protein n=2 Tax=Candidatus Liberibacter solanacearum TaxID=556287 RepID=UPI00387DCF44
MHVLMIELFIKSIYEKTIFSLLRSVALVLFFCFIPNENFAQRIRIASWNINTLSEKSGMPLLKNSVVREDADYDLLRRYAERLNADIVCLQEMGSYAVIKRVFPEDTWEILYSGNDSDEHTVHTAIVARKGTVHVLEKSYLSMDTNKLDSKAGKRRSVEILFKVNGIKIWLLGIHLKSFCFVDSLKDAYTLSCYTLNLQVNWLNKWIHQKKSSNIPFIIGGDFNRKINHFGDNDELWGKISKDTILIRVPNKKRSWCNAHKSIRKREPIDFFVMDQNAYKYLIENSYSEVSYIEEDIKKRGYRLSDHCPITTDYNFENL